MKLDQLTIFVDTDGGILIISNLHKTDREGWAWDERTVLQDGTTIISPHWTDSDGRGLWTRLLNHTEDQQVLPPEKFSLAWMEPHAIFGAIVALHCPRVFDS